MINNNQKEREQGPLGQDNSPTSSTTTTSPTTTNTPSAAEDLFESFLTKKSIFKDKKVFQSNYTPDNVPHRQDQITHIAQILAPTLHLNKPSNLFVYGKTGTGKTLTVLHTTQKLQNITQQKNIPLKIIYFNCKLKRIADTEYRLMAQLAREFGKNIPITGLPTDEIYRTFISVLDEKEQIALIILDEIDQLIKKIGDEILYNLTRINSELKKSQLSIIGISNDLMFVETLDPRVKSSLSEEELVFPPYNAFQIQDILRNRSQKAFNEDVVGPGVIEKCAARAAREHGDARVALEILRVAGEITDRNNMEKISLENLDKAEEKIEKERIMDVVLTHPKQFQCVLYTLLNLASSSNKPVSTGPAYDMYQQLCAVTKLRALTQRRFSDIIAELDMLGVITARVTSKGRYGRTKEIIPNLQVDIKQKVIEVLKSELGIS